MIGTYIHTEAVPSGQVAEGEGWTRLHTRAGDVISVFLLIPSKGAVCRTGIDTCPNVDCGLGPSIGWAEDGLHARIVLVLSEEGDGSGRAVLHADVYLRICEGSIVGGSIWVRAGRLAGQSGIMTVVAPGTLGHA